VIRAISIPRYLVFPALEEGSAPHITSGKIILNPAVDRSFFLFITRMHKHLLRLLDFTLMRIRYRAGLHVFCGTWLRCNSLQWGAPERCPRGPAKRGSGSGGDAAAASMMRWGACIPLRGRTFLRKALLHPSRSRHSASLRLALHPKNRTLHPVQPPDLG
jgi:hypothetical protein